MNTRKGNYDEPTEAPAVAEAEGVLVRAGQFIEALQQTHSSIPQALSQEVQLSSRWGNAAITGGDVAPLHAQLAAARERREADVRRRSAAADGLLALEPELAQARAAADQQRAGLAATVASEFSARWNRACRELAALNAEAQQLSTALHARVDCPPPYVAAMSVVHGQPELRLSLPIEPPPLALPPALASVVAVLDRLDAAQATITGIRQAKEFDVRHYQLSVTRGTPTERAGVYRVIAEFVCPIDGLSFQPGELIDHSLIGQGHLQRLTMGKRYVQPVELEIAAA